MVQTIGLGLDEFAAYVSGASWLTLLHLGHTVLHMDTLTASRRIADVIRDRLRETRRTQLDIVAATGIPRTTLNRRMTGNSPFTVTELELIADFLGMTVTALMVASEAGAA